MDIFKMSNFQKVEENVCEKSILLGDALNTNFLIKKSLA